MTTPARGKDGKAVFGGETFNVRGWTMVEGGSDGDTTSTGTDGVETVTVCTTSYTGTIDMVWDSDASPTRTSPNLERGSTGTLDLYVTATKYFRIAVVILGCTTTSTIKDVITYSCNWQGSAAPTTKPA